MGALNDRDGGIDASIGAGGGAGTGPSSDGAPRDRVDARETGPDVADEPACNTPVACGSGCVMCPTPEHATATCLEGGCGFVCDPDYAENGAECALTAIYVDDDGLDEWEGSPAHPFKTYRRAMEFVRQSAGRITIVNFFDGSYSEEDGRDDFGTSIPEGVTVRKWGNGSVAFLADPDRESRITFAGNGTLIGIWLDGFKRPLWANRGVQIVREVTITNPTGPIEITGNAHLQCSGCLLEVTSVLYEPYARVDGQGHLELRDRTRFDFERIPEPECADVAILVQNSGSLTMADGAHIHGRVNYPVMGRRIESPGSGNADGGNGDAGAGSRIVMRGAIIGPHCGGPSPGYSGVSVDLVSGLAGAPAVDIADSSFHGTVSFVGFPEHVKIRGSRFEGIVGLRLASTNSDLYDLGTANNPGNNTFRRADAGPLPDYVTPHGLFIEGGMGTLRASGNIWLSNEQGADDAGRYLEGRVIESESGPNIGIVGPGRVEL